MQEVAFYEPRYDLVNSDEYKKRIDQIRNKQKELIKTDNAITGAQSFIFNESSKQGSKLIRDMQKIFLRAYNSDCDDVISHVTYSNIELSEKRIKKTCETINKLGKSLKIAITAQYEHEKIEELYLVFEYRQVKQREKEEQKELRAQQREEAKAQKELEEARQKIEKEQKHYQNALLNLYKQLLTADETEKELLFEKEQEIENKLSDINNQIIDIDYRESNMKAGYVYIISNIGAFGENIYKIGMTRRLDPYERVDELGDASVPFNFDVHAMIFTPDAPALESSLHRAFADRKLNMVNQRREFFHVTLDEIKEVVRKNYDKTVEFLEVPPAEQYRESIALRNHMEK